jgi:hypothetical protein
MKPGPRLLAALLLFTGCAAAFHGAGAWSYRAANVPAVHLVFTLACWMLFLVSLSFAVAASTGSRGELRSPRSLADLLCWMLVVVQAGFAAGRLVNYRSSLEIAVAASRSGGSLVHLADDGLMMLDGEIGFATMASLQQVHTEGGSDILELRSGGGLIDSAAEMGSFVQDKGISTFVAEECASACVIVALSGAELYVTPGARFGFHRGSAVASYESELGRFLSDAATDDLISRLRSLGVPEAILSQAAQTPPDGIFFVSGEEFHRAGLADHLVE